MRMFRLDGLSGLGWGCDLMVGSLFLAYNRLLMADEFEKILLPKIKKMDFRCKVILDPSDFRRGLPKTKLPELNDKGLILAL